MVDMTLFESMFDEQIAAMPMPEEYKDKYMLI